MSDIAAVAAPAMRTLPLPTYEKFDCPMCSNFEAGKCQRCGSDLKDIPDPAARPGYISHTFSHYHFSAISGMGAKQAVTAALCLECYRADFAQAYPGVSCPV